MKLLYLYHDLMNLYGESGNVRVLERRLEQQGETVTVERRSLGGELDFAGVDLIYLGAGTERSQKAALEHLRLYAGGLKEALAAGAHLLFTGNAAAMLGKTITDASGRTWEGLGLLEFAVRERSDVRYTGDAIAVHPELSEPLVGFYNHCEDWEGEVPPLLEMTMGRGNRPEGSAEGLRQGNVLGTHLIGPVLVKNPHFCDWLLERLLGRAPLPQESDWERQAWQVTHEALKERKN